jgi:DNA-directed RNA polymerase subunit alpha
LEGAAVTGLRIPGVLHEFSTIKNVKEDVVDVILNVKKLRFKTHGDAKKVVKVKISGPRVVTGADMQTDQSVEVLNKDHYICTVDSGTMLELELHIKKGKGYVLAEQNKEEGLPIDILPLDSLFNPISKVNFWVEKARVGRSTDYDRLIMEIGTDGSISPESAVTEAASILMDHLDLFIFVPDYETPQDSAGASGLVSASPLMNENLLKHIDELELSVRACNCLRNANIKTIADLVQKTEHEMLRTKNFGRKSLNEIKEILNSMGLSFGMRIDADSLEIPALSQRGGMGKNAS